jgi:cyclophilin family peptidyl-prolyl cis-trans isomerase
LVDKPGRRKKSKRPWGKIAGVVVIALVVVASAWYVYSTYIYQPPPVYAKLGTNFGYFDVELFPSCAPKTVSNFVSLSNSGFYNNLVWHRIVDTPTPFVIQTGDPNTRNGINSTRTSWGKGGSNQTVPLETCSWLHNYAGYLGMARQGNQTSGLNSGTSQFYIILSNDTNTESALDTHYTVFGKVISGMSAVCKIADVPTYSSVNFEQPITPVFLKNVTIISAASAPVHQPIVQCK